MEQVDTMQQILDEIGAHMWPITETHYSIRADHNQWQEMQQKTRGNGLKLITHGIRAPKRITISKNNAEQCHELCWVPLGANLTYEYEIAGLPCRILGEELVENISLALIQGGLTIQEEQLRWEKKQRTTKVIAAMSSRSPFTIILRSTVLIKCGSQIPAWKTARSSTY